MKYKIINMLIIFSLLIFIPTTVYSDDISEMNQTNVRLEDQEKAIFQLCERLDIEEQAIIQQKKRTSNLNKDELCFTDIENHWAISQIQYAYTWGVIDGYPDGEFKPDDIITELEGVLMLTNLMNGISGEKTANATLEEINWGIVPKWAQTRLGEETALKIATEGGHYGTLPLNRLSFIIMLAKAADIEATPVSEYTVVFLDQSSISGLELGYVNTLRNMGLIIGNEGKFNPDQFITRSEASVIISRLISIILNNS